MQKNIKEEINSLHQALLAALRSAATTDALEKIRIDFLGRSGRIATLMKQLKQMSLEQKKELGPLFNQLKVSSEQAFNTRSNAIKNFDSTEQALKEKFFDVTAYKPNQYHGSLHIYTQLIQQLEDIFISMGYSVEDGNEVETDYYNFETLNIPADHPARDIHDTFWLNVPNMLLRTHTSTVQAHAMEDKGVPLAVFAPGRCYRNEATDATHEFMFTQAEGLLIDKNISISNLLATAKTFIQKIFERDDIKLRVRPGYFPFVEPGLEIDASCPFCKKGCSICKKTRWIELLGAGLVHPNVLQSSGINPNIYSGFAFGFGLERLAMIKNEIDDIRLFHNGKINFLDQF